MTNQVSFNYIKNLFKEEDWDIGYLSPDNFLRANLHPIKQAIHPFGINYTNDIHFSVMTNVIVLIRNGHTWDYTHYNEAVDILNQSDLKNWVPVYTNFKEAAILSGLGVRAKNSLIYSYKFGFDCHITAIRFTDNIIDVPKNKRINYKLWNKCKGCDDCIKACPVGAIHFDEKNELGHWLNSSACDNFIGLSDHPTIPSIKKFWHEYVHPEYKKEDVDKMVDIFSAREIHFKYGISTDQSLPFDANGYYYDGQVVRKNGELVNVPFCRECTSQPRCSKWNGKYPYEEIYDQKINLIEMALNSK